MGLQLASNEDSRIVVIAIKDCFWMFGRADSKGRPRILLCWVRNKIRKLESKAHQW